MTDIGALRYQQMSLEAMSPGRRVVFIYGFLLGQLHRARRAIEREAVEARNETLGRAQAAVEELVISLDRERGGDIADRLAALYGYFMQELFELDVQPSVDRLDRLVDQIQRLHDAWEQACAVVNGAANGPPGA